MNAEATDDDLPEMPDYIRTNPLLEKYVAYFHQFIDDLEKRYESQPTNRDVEVFLDCLMTIHCRICFEGDMNELDNLLKLHFPEYYPHCEPISTAQLAVHPLTTSN
ncbi:hypothetical protein GCM10027299_29010 [Larkinella ripae]